LRRAKKNYYLELFVDTVKACLAVTLQIMNIGNSFHFSGVCSRQLVLKKKFRQHGAFQIKASVNAGIYDSFIGMTESNPFGKFDPEKMLSALASSGFLDEEDVRKLNMVVWSREMMTLLPIGKPNEYMVRYS
jgi:hypothetical protein